MPTIVSCYRSFPESVVEFRGISVRFFSEKGLVSGTDLVFCAERTRLRTFEQLAGCSHTLQILTTTRSTLPDYLYNRRARAQPNFDSLDRLNLIEFPVAEYAARQWGLGDVTDEIGRRLVEASAISRRLRCWECSCTIMVGTEWRSMALYKHKCCTEGHSSHKYTACVECGIFFMTLKARRDHFYEEH